MSPNVLPLLAAGLGGLFGAMYLDAKHFISRDINQVQKVLFAYANLKIQESKGKAHFYNVFRDRAKEDPNGLFLLFEGKEYTFSQIEKASNRLSHWLLAQNVQKKEVVCMMLQNHPTFFILLYAIGKIGAIPALINTNLAEQSLLHCVEITGSKRLIFDPIYSQNVSTILNACQRLDISLVSYGEDVKESEMTSFAQTITPNVLNTFPDGEPSKELISGDTLADPACLIYTSGTTGLPKPAIVQHIRLTGTAYAMGRMVGINKGDRVYCVLPLYHSSGCIISSSSALVSGGVIVLGRKFSATRFWDDCVTYKVDVFTYIGEFCRYLSSQPPHPNERSHKVKMIYGNGMRPDVWKRFQERFNIPKVCEFYAATEGPASLINISTNDIGIGAIGARGTLFRKLVPDIQLIKIDPISEDPVRDRNGRCVKCDYDEQGELVVRLGTSNVVTYEGYYKNSEATEKKLLRDVFKKGDIYFRSGDLIKMNREGFYYFTDRLGDTFRWKSENVATTEVEEVMSDYPAIAEANVYGTFVPHHDGRAGMALIVLKEGAKVDLEDLYRFLEKRLPSYAIPLFLRFSLAMEVTGTFKLQKALLRNQGIDLKKVPESDRVYWRRGDTYVPFSLEDYATLSAGKAKL